MRWGYIYVYSGDKVELTEDDRFYVRAKVWGEHTLPKECVKGVTYHMLKVEKKNGFWRIQVLLDV